MPWLVTLVLALAAWLAPTGTAQAGTISLTTTVRTMVTGNKLRAEVSLLNQGDEAARDLSLVLEAAGARIEASGPENLPPHQPQQVSLDLPLSLTLPGTYPAVVTVRFHDLNGYAFSSLAHGLFSHQSPSQAWVTVHGLPSQVAGDGAIRFELTNADQEAHTVSLRVAAPQELALDQPAQSLALSPGVRQAFSLAARNLSALAGASYPTLVIIEYESGGRHYSAVAVSPVTVENPPDLVQGAIPYLYALAGLLIAVMIGLQLQARHAVGRTA